MNPLPYIAFIIFFVITFLVTSEEFLGWCDTKSSSRFWTFIVIATIIASIGYIWTGCMIRYPYEESPVFWW
jgi:hypothetical protein